MEKLIELLNEYKEEKNICNTDMDWQLEIWNYRYVSYPCAERLCSKEYGFIKWLVDNDKIDYMKLYNGWCIEKVFYFEGEIDHAEEFKSEEKLLMLLAIQDEPIEFLISILK